MLDLNELCGMRGKNAVITGAASGLGAGIARFFADAGVKVMLLDINEKGGEEVAAKIRASGGDAAFMRCNVTSQADCATAAEAAFQRWGSIDSLVNCAGATRRRTVEDLEEKDWDLVLNVTLKSVYLMCHNVVPYMKKQGHGKIVNMCSMMSEVGRSSVTAYAAAKGGLKMLTKNLATEWAKHNIQVNGIGPGYFATEQTAPIRVNGNPFNEFIVSRTPASRWGDPEDLAGAAVFLASRASDFVNGHILYVDGGILASLGRAANEN